MLGEYNAVSLGVRRSFDLVWHRDINGFHRFWNALRHYLTSLSSSITLCTMFCTADQQTVVTDLFLAPQRLFPCGALDLGLRQIQLSS